MKILHVVCSPMPPGGFEYAVHNLCNGLATRGHEVTLLCKRPGRGMTPIYRQEEAKYRLRTYFLPPTRGLFHRWFGIRAIARAVRELTPEIIHCTMGWPTPVWSLDAFSPPPPGLVAMFQGSDLQLNPEFRYGLRLNPLVDRDVRRTAAECPHLLTISSAMREELVALGAPRERVEVLFNGVHTERYNGALPPRPVEYPYLLAMGRLIPKKGYDLLLTAFASALKTSGSEVHLCIAGEGPERESLLAQALEAGVADRVHLLGFLSEESKVAWLRNARFFVHPARREAFGIVNAEALAAGLPIVAFGIDGLLDIVQDVRSGFLVPPGDVEAFARAMVTLLSDETLCVQMGNEARKTAVRFDWNTVVTALEKYYQTILTLRT